jgi:transposase
VLCGTPAGAATVYRVRTKNRLLQVTGDHLALVRRPGSMGGGANATRHTGLEWRPVAQLQPGDWVVQVQHLPDLGGVKLPDGELATEPLPQFLGAFIGDGCFNALSREQLACPRQRGQREALRVLQLTRAGAVKVAADARRHLKALLVTAPEPLRQALREGTWLRQARACAALTAQPSDPVEYRATVRALRATAERALAAHQEARQLGKELRVLARAVAPALLAQRGVGPVTAAQVLISWSHPGRLRSEAAFAMLAGAAPIEASSGRVVRHRLNRGGDRQLNRALHTIVMIRERYHEPTRQYVARRRAEGKSEREIRRCRKRTVARQLFRLLERQAPTRVTA